MYMYQTILNLNHAVVAEKLKMCKPIGGQGSHVCQQIHLSDKFLLQDLAWVLASLKSSCMLKFQRGITKEQIHERIQKVKSFLYYVNTNSYPKFDVNILQDDREKCGKLNKRKYRACNQVSAIKV